MICRKCGQDKVAGDFIWKTNGKIARGQKCKECCREIYQQPGYQDNQRDNHLRRLYGISIQDYNTIFERQNGKCAICKKESEATGKNSRLHVDHDHKTGKTRGLICYKCNIAMGFLAEDEERIYRILDYLSIRSFEEK